MQHIDLCDVYQCEIFLSLIRLLYSAKEPEPLFVFEDATTQGYGLSAAPLSYEETLFVMTRLAKFHAASVFLDRDVKNLNCHQVFIN